MIRVAINGFGRIGRISARYLLENKNIELVAINDLTDEKTLAHLFKYDSVHRTYPEAVKAGNKLILIGDKTILCFAAKNPEELPWKEWKIDVVIESTGHFTTREEVEKHIKAGAKKVIISAPAKSEDIKTIVPGVNDYLLNSSDVVLSNASCTTNCAAPMIKVIDELCF